MKVFIQFVFAMALLVSSAKAEQFGGVKLAAVDKMSSSPLIVVVHKGEQLKVSARTNSDVDQDVSIYLFESGKRIKYFDNLNGPQKGIGEWTSPVNDSDTPIIYAVTPNHLMNGAWYSSWTRPLYSAENNTVWGCEDGRDMSYNDVIITLTLIPAPKAPTPPAAPAAK